MNIVFVNPPLNKRILHGEWDLSDVDSVTPPLSLLSLASVCREKGFNPSIVDSYAQHLNLNQTIAEVFKKNPNCVGLTATTPALLSALTVARAIKKTKKDVITIIGGSHVTSLPIETMENHQEVDFGVIGEGEETLSDLLNTIFRNGSLQNVSGIVYRDSNNKAHVTPPRPFIGNLDSLPFPAWDLLPSMTDDYHMSIVGTRNKRSTALVTSRGCPGRCTFCDTKTFGRRYRAFSAEYVVSMLEYLKSSYGFEDFLFYDDGFTIIIKRLRQICQMILDRNLNISWSCCARVDHVNSEILNLMHQAGCWQIEYGIESGSQEILDFMKKGITIEQVKRALSETKKAGIMTRGNFILGNLKETTYTLHQSLALALKTDLDYFQQTFLTPYPGSEIYHIANQYGSFDPDLEKMNNMTINFIPTGLTREYLISFSRKAFLRFYLRPKIIISQLKLIRTFEDLSRLIRSFFAFLETIFRRRRSIWKSA